MSAGVEVDVDALRRAGEQLTRAAERLDREWAAFSSQVQSMGDIFGDDAVGGLIGASYQAAHQIAAECFVSVAESFDDFGAGLEESADNHEANELEIAELFSRMMR
ncbi:WXG100 family type VII secretion target [Micromonospora sp. URMC 103]|uniref:WXG100 family type VII secretion target n=1 Tax=Micromonospora sp. URMC 103 TaxID=3423406 RepID=UPI003F19A205